MDIVLRRAVVRRSFGRCEAFVSVGDGHPYRCQNRATDIHHLLTKGRGGANLDKVGEVYHLIHLCRECHQSADGGEAYDGGMLIQGSVTWDRFYNKPVYTGPDDYLTKRYGRGVEPNVERHATRSVSESTP